MPRSISDRIARAGSLPFQSISFKLCLADLDERPSTSEEIATDLHTVKRCIAFGRIRANDKRKEVKEEDTSLYN